MAKVIDIQDLREEEVKLVQNFIDLLRKRSKRENNAPLEKEKIHFGAWALGAKGLLTRKEIYDYL